MLNSDTQYDQYNYYDIFDRSALGFAFSQKMFFIEKGNEYVQLYILISCTS